VRVEHGARFLISPGSQAARKQAGLRGGVCSAVVVFIAVPAAEPEATSTASLAPGSSVRFAQAAVPRRLNQRAHEAAQAHRHEGQPAGPKRDYI